MNMPNAKLLLVDDEPAFIEILAQRLRKRSFDAACVNSGARNSNTGRPGKTVYFHT